MKKTIRLRIIGFFLLAGLVGGCTDDKTGDDVAERYNVKGTVEKGPYVKGSEVKVYELNPDFTPTGRNFSALITDNKGHFSLGEVELVSPYVKLVASGYFYNEVTGALSEGTLTLGAIADLSDRETVNVNILTHLKQGRVETLLAQGKAYDEANSQAQEELLKIFGLQQYASKDLNSLTVTSGDAGAGVLIIPSAVLLGRKTEAEFTEYLAALSELFKEQGDLPAEEKEKIRKDAISREWKYIRQCLIDRYEELGEEITVPDLNYFVDWDGNGVAGDELGDPSEEKKLNIEVDTLRISKEGGYFEINIDANLIYSLTPPDQEGPKDDVIVEDFLLNMATIIDYNFRLNPEQHRLEIDVKPAAGLLMHPGSITVYSIDGRLSDQIILLQEGDAEKLELSQELKEILSNLLESARNAADLLYTMEAYYTRCYPQPENQYPWLDFYLQDARRMTTNNEIIGAWKDIYYVIGGCNFVVEHLEPLEPTGSIASIFTALRAMEYAQLVLLWGNIPYAEKYAADYVPPQIGEEKVYENIIRDLQWAKSHWPVRGMEKFKDILSADQIGLLLSKVYMMSNRYAEALPFLEELLQSGKYTFETDRHAALNEGSRELISRLKAGNNYRREIEDNIYLSFGRYTEVMLLAAECEYETGAPEKAEEYLSQVRNHYQLSAATDSSFIDRLEQTWKEVLKGEFSYFAFLKRHQLYEEKLGIAGFQGLFPIPASEIDRGYCQQNPGY